MNIKEMQEILGDAYVYKFDKELGANVFVHKENIGLHLKHLFSNPK